MEEIKYEDYKGLIKNFSIKFSKIYKLEYEEVEAEGNLLFVKLLNKYDKTKGKFSTYFVKSFLNEVLKMQKCKSLREKCICPVDDPDSLYDLIKHKRVYEFLNCYINELTVQEMDKFLSDREEKIISLYYFHGNTLKEIAQTLCISTERVRQIKDVVLNKLKLQLA